MSRHATTRKPAGASLAAPTDTPRLVVLAGLETASGGPVLAMASGPARRPVLTALVTFAALAMQATEGGNADAG